jgi:uncharacterized membrane protein YphA (DoxX/SURF4 family)
MHNNSSSIAPKSIRSFIPILIIFATAVPVTLVTQRGWNGYMGFVLCTLATLKLMDLSSFATSFRKYDLIAKQLPPYGFIYPFLELAIGLAFLAGNIPPIASWGATLVGASGTISVFKAVYIDRKSLYCACLGGNSQTPLGLISLLENALMAGMGTALILGIAM